MIFVLRDLFETPARYNTVWLIVRHRRLVLGPLKVIMFFDQQPVRLALIRSSPTHANQRPFPLHLRPVHDELQRAGPQPLIYIRVTSLRLPRALVPHHHRPAAILPLWNDPLKAAILHRMIFHLHGQPLVCP